MPKLPAYFGWDMKCPKGRFLPDWLYTFFHEMHLKLIMYIMKKQKKVKTSYF